MESKFKQTKLTLSLRIAVGIYVIYLGGSLVQNLDNYTGTKQLIFAVCAFFFIIAGVGLTVHDGYKYYKGAYVGGKLDSESISDNNDCQSE